MFKAFTNTNYATQNLSNLGTDTTFSVVTSSLFVYLDAGNIVSYPRSGSVWRDLSGNAKNARLSFGGSGDDTGYFTNTDGGLFYFLVGGGNSDGPGAFCGNLSSGSSIFSSGFTVDIFFQATPEQFSRGYSYSMDANLGYGFSAPGPKFDVNSFSDSQWTYGINDSNYYTQVATPSGAPALTMGYRWNSCCITYDSGSNSSVTYYNGAPTGRSRTTVGSPTGWSGSMQNFVVGRGSSGGSGRGFSGNVGDCLVYTRALTAQEVAQNFYARAYRYNSCCNGVPSLPER